MEAILASAKTMIDGGWRVAFDFAQDQAPTIAELTKLREQRIYLVVMTEEQWRGK